MLPAVFVRYLLRTFTIGICYQYTVLAKQYGDGFAQLASTIQNQKLPWQARKNSIFQDRDESEIKHFLGVNQQRRQQAISSGGRHRFGGGFRNPNFQHQGRGGFGSGRGRWRDGNRYRTNYWDHGSNSRGWWGSHGGGGNGGQWGGGGGGGRDDRNGGGHGGGPDNRNGGGWNGGGDRGGPDNRGGGGGGPDNRNGNWGGGRGGGRSDSHEGGRGSSGGNRGGVGNNNGGGNWNNGGGGHGGGGGSQWGGGRGGGPDNWRGGGGRGRSDSRESKSSWGGSRGGNNNGGGNWNNGNNGGGGHGGGGGGQWGGGRGGNNNGGGNWNNGNNRDGGGGQWGGGRGGGGGNNGGGNGNNGGNGNRGGWGNNGGGGGRGNGGGGGGGRDHDHGRTRRAVLPTNFDWRDYTDCQSLDDIRYQQCGDCWSVSSTSAMSDRYCLWTHQNKFFSARQVTTCSYPGEGGCDGGWPKDAMEMYKNKGVASGGDPTITDEAKGCLAYPDELTKSSVCPTACDSKAKLDATKAGDYYEITSKNVTEIMQEIYDYGPVVAIMEIFDDFGYMGTGVYQHASGASQGYHAIRLIGYGEQAGVPYWLAANSWGPEWGDKGYFKILRGKNHCDIESWITCVYPAEAYN